MAGKIKGITIEIGGDTRPLNKALDGVNKNTKSLQSELRSVDRLLKLDPKNTELLTQKQKLLKDAIQNTKEKLDTLKDAEKQAQQQFKEGKISEEQYRALKREIEATSQSLDKMEGSLDSVNRKWQESADKISKVGDKMQSAGKTLTRKVTAPIVAGGVLASKVAIDYESAFAGVRKTVDATEEEYADLSQSIRDMALEVPIAATEIAGIVEAAGQLGIDKENMIGFTRVMADLGVATNITSEEASQLLAQFANVTQMDQKDFDKLGSVIVDLGNNMATTEADIVNMAQRLAGAGSQIGLSEAEIMGFAASLSSVGIEAEAGGSAFSKLMVNMLLAIETGKGLKDFAGVAGMSSKEFKKAFKEDAAGAIQTFITGLGKAEEEGKSAIKILDDMGIKEVRLRDALLRSSGAGELMTDAISIANDAWKDNSALTKEASQRYETTASQLTILKNTLVDLAIMFADEMLPTLRAFVDKLKGLLNWFRNLSPGAKKLIIVIAAMVAAIGPLLFELGLMASGLGAIMTAFGAVGVAIGAITAPVLIAIGIIAALIAIGVALYKNWDNIKAGLASFVETWKTGFNNIKESVRDKIAEIVETLKSLPGDMLQIGKDAITGLIDGIKEKLRNLKETVGSIGSTVIDGIRKVLKIKSPSRVMLEMGEYTTEGFSKGLTNSLSRVRAAAGEISGSVVETVNSNIRHSGNIQIAGVNNQGELIAASQWLFDDYSTSQLHRQLRRNK